MSAQDPRRYQGWRGATWTAAAFKVVTAVVSLAAIGAIAISTIQGQPKRCFTITSPATPVRSSDVVVIRDGHRVQVTNDHVSMDPAFSPTGDRVVYASGRDGEYHPEFGFERLALFISDIETGRQQRLTDGPYDHQPDWSPTGSGVAFVRTRFRDNQDPQVDVPIRDELWVVDETTKQERLLLRGSRFKGDPYRFYSPAWSPDGQRIAFSQASHSDHEVRVTNSDGSRTRTVLDDTGLSYFDSPSLSWSPDAQLIALNGATAETYGIFTADTKTGELHFVHEGGSLPVWSPDGPEIAFFDSLPKDRGDALTILDVERGVTEVIHNVPIDHYDGGRFDWRSCAK